MKGILSACALLALATPWCAHGQGVPTTNPVADLIGRWNSAEVGTYFGTAVIRKLRNGTIHAVNYEKSNGRTYKTAEFWLYTNGRSLNKVYVEEPAVLSGTWRAGRNSIERDYGGYQRYSLRRISRDRWVDSIIAEDGTRWPLMTLTRIR